MRASLLAQDEASQAQLHAMPVESVDLGKAAGRYAATLLEVAGSPPVLDLVHLGLGADGHTASLVPGDAVLDVTDADVALTGAYQGRRRMTMTYPALNRARRVLWLVTGEDKAAMLVRLCRGDVEHSSRAGTTGPRHRARGPRGGGSHGSVVDGRRGKGVRRDSIPARHELSPRCHGLSERRQLQRLLEARHRRAVAPVRSCRR